MTLNLQPLKDRFGRLPKAARWLGAGVAALVLYLFYGGWSAAPVRYFTAPVEQGDIQAIVNATGTINAVTTVQVGSQVTGMIAELGADFNSRVRKGQVIAQIDAAIFGTRVLQAEADLASSEAGVKSLDADLAVSQANLDRARAGLREAGLNWKRTQELLDQGIASPQQRDSVEVAFESAGASLKAAEAQLNQTRARIEQQRAQVKQRQAQLEQARVDLDHTVIRAPIDGTVIARNVDVGQTVAASLQAPTLFTIAQDLTKMLVYAKTDESDVGRIRPGVEASFTVDSFPKESFHGAVQQVRMNAYTVQNVVTYDTVIEFENADLKLLPGMTAYVTIPVAEARRVVKIPNGALRFKPDLTEPERTALLRKYGLLREPGSGNGAGTAQAAERGPTGAGTSGLSGNGGAQSSAGAQGGQSGRERSQNMSPDERARLRAQYQARQRQREEGGEESASGPRRNLPPRSGPGAAGEWQVVWKLAPDNTLQPVRIRTGLTDFTFTAMDDGELKAGDQLVIGQTFSFSPSQRPPGGMGGPPRL